MLVEGNLKAKLPGSRSHPWTCAELNISEVYVDFKIHPEKIEETLEDYQTITDEPAAEKFYGLLRYLNGPDSHLETSDCALGQYKKNDNNLFDKGFQRSGRLMVLYKDLELNVIEQYTTWLQEALLFHLKKVDTEFEYGFIELSFMNTDFVTLNPVKSGKTVVIDFWAFGNSENDILKNLERLFIALCLGLKNINKEIKISSGS